MVRLVKRTIKSYEIRDLGVDHEQYFPGYGVVGSTFDAAYVGIGATLAEAIEDACAMAATSGVDTETVSNASQFSRGALGVPLECLCDEDDECPHHHYAVLCVEFNPDPVYDLVLAARSLLAALYRAPVQEINQRVATLEARINEVEAM